jgi:O-antigen ligase
MTVRHSLHAGASPFQTAFLSFGKPALIWIGLGLGSFLIASLNLLYDGDIGAVLTVIGVTLIPGLSLLRPKISLYILVFLGLAIEQYPNDYAWTKDLMYYHDRIGNVLPAFSGISVTQLEVHFLLIISGLLLRLLMLKEPRVPPIAAKPLLFYSCGIVFFVVYGLFRGGDFLPALWEVRGIIILTLLMVIVPQLIRTEAHVAQMIWVVIAGLGFRAIEVVYHFVNANFTFIGVGWGSHEDAGMLGILLVFTYVLYLLKIRQKQQLVVTLLVVPIILAIVAADRRAVYPVLASAFVLVGVLQPPEVQRKLTRTALKAGIVFALYLGVFWNSRSDGIWVMPARSIREGIAGADEEGAGESYSSNLYREAENHDLARMARGRPLLGSGYGVKIDYYLPIPVGWALGFYIPHNQLLAVFAKTGIVGFVIFILFYLSVLAEISYGFARLVKDKYLRAVLVFAGAALMNHLVYSFYDLTLTFYRCNVFLGTLLGVAATILAVEGERKEAAPPSPPEEQKRSDTPAHWLLNPHEEGAPQLTV